MDFISETKFNAPIKGGLPSTRGNDKGDLRIDSNLALGGDFCEGGSFSIYEGIQVGGSSGGVTIGDYGGCGQGRGTVRGGRAVFDHGQFDILEISDTARLCADVCAYGLLGVLDQIRFATGTGNKFKTCYWTLMNNSGQLNLTGCQGCSGNGVGSFTIRSNSIVNIDNLNITGENGGGITLDHEKITSWSDLKQYVGGNENKIQRFTSPQLPAECSQFCFEGDGTVTGTELPIIQVRETATGKLVQMDVWVNLDEACTGYTLGKPVAEVEPCSSVIEAGKWTAIVMS